MDIILDHLPGARCSIAWLIQGHELPSKVTLGSHDCPLAVHLDIVNRSLSRGRYTRALRIAMGSVAILDRHVGHEQSYNGEAGAFHFEGSRTAPLYEPGQLDTFNDGEPPLTSAWRVTAPTGTTLLLAPHPQATSHHDIRSDLARDQVFDILKKLFVGRCSVSRVDAGEFTALEDLAPATGRLWLTPN